MNTVVLGRGVCGPVFERNGLAVKTIDIDQQDVEHKYDLTNYKNITFPPPRNCDIPHPEYFTDNQPFIPGINPWRELAIVQSLLGTPGVVQYVNHEIVFGALILETKIAGNITLSQWLMSDEYELTILIIILEKIKNILLVLQLRNIVHMDLKPSNIVLDNSLNPTIIDFGWSMSDSLPMSDDEYRYYHNNKYKDYLNLINFIKYKYKKNI